MSAALQPRGEAHEVPAVACRATLITANLPVVAFAVAIPVAFVTLAEILSHVAPIGGTALAVIGVALSVGAARVALRARAGGLWPRRRLGSLVVDGAGVSLDGAPILRRAELAGGSIVQTGPGEILVRLSRRFGKPPVIVSVRDRRDGEAILDGLHLHPWQRVTTFRLNGRPLGSEVIIVVVLLGLIGMVGLVEGLRLLSLLLALAAVAAPAVIMVVRARIQRSRLSIGDDGVLVDAFRHRDRFLPHEEIARVEGTFLVRSPDRIGTLHLVLRGGSVISLNGRSEDVAALHDSLHAAQDHYRRTSRLASRVATTAMVESLALARRGAGDAYRSASLSAEQLFELVEDASVSASDRTLAAQAIAADLDAGSAARLHALAERTAAPELRRVFFRLAAQRQAQTRG